MLAIFHTLGCKVNQYETQVMRDVLTSAGWDVTSGEDVHKIDASVLLSQPVFIIINSCTVTGESDRKLGQLIRRYRKKYPDAALVLTGCMPQAFPDTAAHFDEVEIILGNASRKNILHHLEKYLIHHQRIVAIENHNLNFEEMNIDHFDGKTRAFVKIQDGCNRFCSYCIIPYARGRVRSKPLADLKNELETLASSGYKEVVLVGINLMSYGTDFVTSGTGRACEKSFDLCDAIETAYLIPGIERIRLGSLEPDNFSLDLVHQLSKYKDKLCPQFHLSLQSGCSSTLKRMNRGYDAHHFREICALFRMEFQDCAITTDIMVGFPDESEEEFTKSYNFANEISFAKAHIFAYSKRDGTLAAKMNNQTPSMVKKERSAKLVSLCNDSAQKYLSSFVSKTVAVLCEKIYADGTGGGYSPEYVHVHFECKSTPVRPGDTVSVNINRYDSENCYGTIL